MNKTKREEILKLKTEEEVSKYANEHNMKRSSVEREQRRFRPSPVGSNHKVVILPDIHYPHQDNPSMNAVMEFVEDWKPDEVILLGDALDVSPLDPHQRKKLNARAFEGKRLLRDYEGFIREILEPIEKLCPKAKKVYMGGNHEEWVYQEIDRNPQLEGLIEPEITMRLKHRGWEWIPYLVKQASGRTIPGMYKTGKLTWTHGQYTNIYHAAKMANVYDKSVAYGHTHDVQLHTKVHAEDPSDYHTAQSIGCLCNLSPGFMWGRPNRWVHSFGVLEVRETGLYNLYVPIIIDGKFRFDGKTYGN